MIKRRQNRIETCKECQHWIANLKDISSCLAKKFIDLYNTTTPTFPEDLNGLGRNVLTIEENFELIRCPNKEEIKDAIWTLNPLKSLGPNGYPRIFYQTYWNILQEKISNFVKECFLLRKIPLQRTKLSSCWFLILKTRPTSTILDQSGFVILAIKLLQNFWLLDIVSSW